MVVRNPRIRTAFPASDFWTTSPAYFAIRAGVLMTTVSALYGLARVLEVRGIALHPLARFGRDSLFVYWIHVELVYGLISLPLHKSLRLWEALVALGLFSLLMLLASLAKDRAVAAWRERWAGNSRPAGAG